MEEDKPILKKSKNFKSSVLLDIAGNSSEEVISKINCKVCSSEFRREAEEKYDLTNNIRTSWLFIREKGVDVSFPSFRNHLLRHYIANQRRMQIKEYAEDIEEILVQKRDKRSQLLEKIAMLEKEMYDLASSNSNVNLEEKRKNNEVIRKMAETSLNYQNAIDEMDNQLKPLDIMLQNFQNIISEELKRNKSEEVKNALMNVFNKLTNTVQDIMVESD